jgi:hypothetical protein
MGRKNNRDRQSRLQRKRNKRAAARAIRRKTAGAQAASPWDSPQDAATETCIVLCGGLLAGCGELAGEMLQAARMAHETFGGILGRLPIELNAFLHEGREWSVTCADLESLRDSFEELGAGEVFERLWSLALTNEPEATAFATAPHQDCPHRAAFAFEALRACLDDPKIKPDKVLRAIVAEIEKHGPRGTGLAKAYSDLLRTAIAAVHAAAAELENALSALAGHYRRVFDRYSREHVNTAWWHCGGLFLREVLERVQTIGSIKTTTAYADLVTLLLDAPQAAVLVARATESTQSLRSIHFKTTADAWRSYLEREIDARSLTFEERIRYEIARLKLLRAEAQRQAADDDTEAGDFLAAFEALQRLLARGVPPASREIPGLVELPLMDFFVETIQELRCEGVALGVTEQLLRRRPDDFRLACLYATGAVVRGELGKLSLLASKAPRRHVDPELFAHCALTWSGLPRGMKAAAMIRPNLFDPLDREHRKQSLIKLSQHCLRRAATVAGYAEALRALLPYFERDNFVYRDLHERAAVESSLVFLATMMAPLHTLKLVLTEDQSQQWVSYAREISQHSSLGSQLALHFLKAPSRWFTLDPGVRNSASARLSDFQPAAAQRQIPPPRAEHVPHKSRKRRKKAKDKEAHDTQRGLFDATGP